MIPPPKDPCALKGKNITRRFHNAEFTTRPGLVAAEETLVRFSKEPATVARFKGQPCLGNRGKKLFGPGVGGAKQPEGDAFGAPRADSREPPELSHQFAKRVGIIKEGHFSVL